MTQTIQAMTNEEFWAMSKALDFLTKNQMTRVAGGLTMRAMAVVGFTCIPETRTVKFTFNADAMRVVGFPVPDTANGVIDTAMRVMDSAFQPSLDGMIESLLLRIELEAYRKPSVTGLGATNQADTGRLRHALNLLDYKNAKELHHKSNLVHAIKAFAEVAGDADLTAECESEIQRIRAEIAAKE